MKRKSRRPLGPLRLAHPLVSSRKIEEAAILSFSAAVGAMLVLAAAVLFRAI